jgi:hypothetical protein
VRSDRRFYQQSSWFGPSGLDPRPLGSGGFEGHGLQHLLVHISELLNVEAALAGGVLAELRQQSSYPLDPFKQ